MILRPLVCWAMLGMTPPAAVPADTVFIDAGLIQSAAPFNRLLLGSNISWTDGADGMFDPASGAWRRTARALLDAIPLGALRFPGGHLAETYEWEGGIGPRDQRGWGLHLNGTRHRMVFGTDEFLSYCEGRTIAPVLTVAMSPGSVESTRRWVEYCNGPSSTVEGARRASNGHPLPYDVRWWELGNEVYLADASVPAARAYLRRANATAEAIKQMDPGTRVAAILSGARGGWDSTVVDGLGPAIDLVSLHIYYVSDDVSLSNARLAVAQVDRTLRDTRALLDRTGRRVGVAVTEFGALPTDGRTFRNRPPDHFPALMHAGALCLFARDSVTLATKWVAASPGQLYFADILRSHTGQPVTAPSYALQAGLFSQILERHVRSWLTPDGEAAYLLTADRDGTVWNLLAVNLTERDREIVVAAATPMLAFRSGTTLSDGSGARPMVSRLSDGTIIVPPFSVTSITYQTAP